MGEGGNYASEKMYFKNYYLNDGTDDMLYNPGKSIKLYRYGI